ncbi:MAG: alpha,alpha-trehalose-phosphate synthase (UDP-forming) [Gemmatimonadales bacterium]
MRLSLRFIVPLLLVLAVVAYAVTPLVDRLTSRWFVRDLDSRATVIASAARESIVALAQDSTRSDLARYITQLTQDERLFAVAYCPSPEAAPVRTATLPAAIRCNDLDRYTSAGALLQAADGPLLVSVRSVGGDSAAAPRLVMVHDLSYITRRSAETRKYLFLFFIGLGVMVSLITVTIAQLSWRGWVQGLRGVLRGDMLLRPGQAATTPELRPIADDLRALIRDLESEHRAPDPQHLAWTPQTLRGVLQRQLRGQEVIVVANREPYIHERTAQGITVRRPASGLVTALEPIMRACSGTWIAHGSGSADRDVVDRHDKVAVPPGEPSYQLRRVWLTPEEEQGYYYGFANEGLWPLCHIAHVRPTFRTPDWEQYVRVNRRFARTVVADAESTDPIVLVQDYHFALAPRMIREALPDATIIAFWHIPWPNPEAFGICPWREELLDGMLGSTILGFHTQFHCNNFLDTVDRHVEARVDRELFTVSSHGHVTAVNRYPISVEWPTPARLVARSIAECRAAVRQCHHLPPDHLIGIGVDRLDYTKGIEERFRAVERLLELYPSWVGNFTLIQVGAPTRSRIDQYHDYEQRVIRLAERINAKFCDAPHPPIVLKVEHHEPESIYEHYRAADVALVTSLHDGMNLVAKEFVSARDDERGVLILSQFTGAARELPEALVVNPYDADQCAAALNLALEMPAGEQRARVRLMRGLIQEFNVYRWAGRMLIDAAGTRRRERLLARTTGITTGGRQPGVLPLGVKR